jgi:spore coat protein U-like protein
MMKPVKNRAMMNPALRLGLVLLLAPPLPAMASCGSCTCAVSATGVSFGRYSAQEPQSTDDTGNIRVSCGGGVGSVAYTIQLSPGIYGNGFRPREMGNGANRLGYNLYADAAHTAIWGDGSNGTSVVSGLLDVSAAGSSREHVVYGRIPAGQTSVAVGNYSDTIMFTVIYQ